VYNTCPILNATEPPRPKKSPPAEFEDYWPATNKGKEIMKKKQKINFSRK